MLYMYMYTQSRIYMYIHKNSTALCETLFQLNALHFGVSIQMLYAVCVDIDWMCVCVCRYANTTPVLSIPL